MSRSGSSGRASPVDTAVALGKPGRSSSAAAAGAPAPGVRDSPASLALDMAAALGQSTPPFSAVDASGAGLAKMHNAGGVGNARASLGSFTLDGRASGAYRADGDDDAASDGGESAGLAPSRGGDRRGNRVSSIGGGAALTPAAEVEAAGGVSRGSGRRAQQQEQAAAAEAAAHSSRRRKIICLLVLALVLLLVVLGGLLAMGAIGGLCARNVARGTEGHWSCGGSGAATAAVLMTIGLLPFTLWLCVVAYNSCYFLVCRRFECCGEYNEISC